MHMHMNPFGDIIEQRGPMRFVIMHSANYEFAVTAFRDRLPLRLCPLQSDNILRTVTRAVWS